MSDTLPPPLDPPGHVEPRLFDFPQPEPPPPATLSLDTAEVSATQALYRAAIGPVNTERYLQLFTRFEAADRVVPSWNWAASLCTLGWMLFRRMGLGALVYLAVAAVLWLAAGMLAGLVFRGAPEMQLGTGLAAALVLLMVPGILGDYWLYGHIRKRMARALADSTSWPDAAALLGRSAVGWPRAVWVGGAHLVLAGLVAAALLLVPGAGGPGVSGSSESLVAQALEPPASAPVPVISSPAVTASEPTPASAATAASTPASASAAAAAPSDPVSAPAAALPGPAVPAAVTAAASAPALVASQPQAALATTPDPSPKLASSPKASPAPSARGSHLLNVGLFAVESNARAAHARLRAAGLPATMDELQTRNGPRTRVRAGPFASRAAAEAAARRIRAMGLEAQHVPAGAAAAR